jgi:hypothetical protein
VKRLIGMIIAIVGVASLVFGIIFIIQSNSGKQEVIEELKPVELSELNAKYDTVTGYFNTSMAAEEPKIQAKQALPSVTYDYFAAQRALLGLGKANIGLTNFVMMSGIVDIILGLGFILAGVVLCKKQAA